MAEKKDYYLILGVPRDASGEGIRKAFCRLAKASHPDRSGSEETDAFHQVVEAYEVLSDPERRRRYDGGLAAASGPGPAAGGVGAHRPPRMEPPGSGFRARPRFAGQPEPLVPGGAFAAEAEPLIPVSLRDEPAAGRPGDWADPGRPGSFGPRDLVLRLLLRALRFP